MGYAVRIRTGGYKVNGIGLKAARICRKREGSDRSAGVAGTRHAAVREKLPDRRRNLLGRGIAPRATDALPSAGLHPVGASGP